MKIRFWKILRSNIRKFISPKVLKFGNFENSKIRKFKFQKFGSGKILKF